MILKTPCECSEWSSTRDLSLDGMCSLHNPLVANLSWFEKRYKNILYKHGIFTVIHLMEKPKEYIYSIKGLGLKGIGEIEKSIKELGIDCPFSQKEKYDRGLKK